MACASGAEGPHGVSAFIVEKGTPGLSFGALRSEDGLACPTHRGGGAGRVRVPAEAMLRRRRRRRWLGIGDERQRRNGPISQHAARWWRAGRLTKRAPTLVTDRPSADRCSTVTVRLPSTWLPGCRRRECCCGGPQVRSMTTTPTRSSCAMASAATSPTLVLRSPTRSQLHGGYGYLVRVWSGECPSRPAGASHPGRDQRDHAQLGARKRYPRLAVL